MTLDESRSAISDLLVAISGSQPLQDARLRRRAAALGAVVVLNALLVAASLAILVQAAFKFWPLSLTAGAIAGIVVSVWLSTIVRVLDHVRPGPRAALGALAIALTAIIAFGAAQPLVMTVFNAEIAAQVTADNAAQLSAADRAIAANPRYGDAAIRASRAHLDELSPSTIAQPATEAEINADPGVRTARAELDRLYRKLSALPVSLCTAVAVCPATGTASSSLPVVPTKPALPSQAGGVVQALADRWTVLSDSLNSSREQAARGIGVEHEQIAKANLAKFKIAARETNKLRAEQRQSMEDARNVILGDHSVGSRYTALGELRHRYPSVDAEYWLLTVFLVVVSAAVVPLKLLERSRNIWAGHPLSVTWA